MSSIELITEEAFSLPCPYAEAPVLTDWATTLKVMALKISSYLNEPICKVREYYYSLYTLKETCKTNLEKIARVAFLVLGIAVYSVLTPITAPFGTVIRAVTAAIASQHYIYLNSGQSGKVLPKDKKITLVAHNACYMPAGYSITDGQVTPPSDTHRMVDINVATIKKLNPDVVCLYEVADIRDADTLSSHLSDYPFVIPVAGFRAIGPSSCLYVASKYEIDEKSIEFIAFEKGTEVTGRAEFAEKGFLSFDIKNPGAKNAFATIVSTHLQHSETPSDPEKHEKTSREAEMLKIAGHIERKVAQGGKVIFMGDLNQPEKDIEAFFKKHHIQWIRDEKVRGEPTWGGDAWCSKLMGKKASEPEVLDYAFAAGKGIDIQTQIVKMDYKSDEFRPEAGSDHDLLFSTATLK